MSEGHGDDAARLLQPFTPGTAGTTDWGPDEVAVDPPTLADRDARTAEFLAEWRNASYNCFSSGHKFCREVCPVVQVSRNETWSPTAFHANVVAMERGQLDVEDMAADYVNCTQCGACELRCPNTLFTGDFYRFRTRTVDVVKAVRALAVDSDIHQPGWQRWNALTDERLHEPCWATRRWGKITSATGPRASTIAAHPRRGHSGGLSHEGSGLDQRAAAPRTRCNAPRRRGQSLRNGRRDAVP
jgi:ferredoxin